MAENAAVQECIREMIVQFTGMAVIAKCLIGSIERLGRQGPIEEALRNRRLEGDANAEGGEGIRVGFQSIRAKAGIIVGPEVLGALLQGARNSAAASSNRRDRR